SLRLPWLLRCLAGHLTRRRWPPRTRVQIFRWGALAVFLALGFGGGRFPDGSATALAGAENGSLSPVPRELRHVSGASQAGASATGCAQGAAVEQTWAS